MTNIVNHWIGGKTAEGASGTYGPVTNPATGAVTTKVAFASVDEVDAAVAAAKDAYLTWGQSSLAQRTSILFKFRALLDAHRDEIAELITAEHGKVHSDALGEVARGLEIVDLACGITVQLKGELSTQVATRVDVSSIRQPLGVVAGITPFNFPAMVPMWMFPIAIACGNTFVLKPSEKDPSAAMKIAELFSEAGLPDGVFNVVHGDKVAVDRLLEHPDVKAVSFVGSTPIARYIHATASANGKRVQALGGAKNHMLVLPDADLDAAADAAVSAAYGSAGERCMAIPAVVAVGAVGDELVEKIRERAEKIKIGPGDDPASEMGPSSPRAPRQGGVLRRGRGRPRAARSSWTAPGTRSTATRTATGSASPCWTGCRPRRRPTRTRSSARSCACCAPRPTRRASRSSTPPLRQRHRDLHPGRRRGLPLPAGGRGRHGRRERPDPGPRGLPLLRRLEGLALRRPPHLRQRRHALLHPCKVVTTRWPDPADGPAGVDLGFPRNH